jgi:surfactin synthase thioesterase subunit
MSGKPNSSKWFVIPRPNRNARLRLICFPYAGGSAFIYTGWSRHLPADVELVAVQAPGRADRISEQAYTDMASLIADLYAAIERLIDRPYVLLGHSLGSRVAFELARELRRRGHPSPAHFIASGSAAPHLPARGKRIHDLPRKEFLAELRDLDGTPDAVFDNQELVELCLPMLRADFTLSETYVAADEPPLACGFTIFAGERDKDITQSDLLAWKAHFTQSGDITQFPEGHFFIDKLSQRVLAHVNELVRDILGRVTPPVAPASRASS